LDARFVHGSKELFEEFDARFWADVNRCSARAFVDAKMAERDSRHKRSGESRFRVEPNLKDGKGGLRDLHTVHWLSKYLVGLAPGQKAVREGVFTPGELAMLRRSEDFLWTVRCHLHFLTGRAEERLTFDVQREMAQRLHYKDRGGLSSVERFMKHYFLVAKDVGDLTRILSAALEAAQLKSVPQLDRLMGVINWKTRRAIRRHTDFKVENDRIMPATPQVFKSDPINLFRIFRLSEESGMLFHPEAFRATRRAARLMDDKVRASPEAAEIFLQLLCDGRHNEAMLRRMHTVGLLGRYIPEFRTVTSMMQFNMYHHYTVDEHLLRTAGEIRAIEDGDASDELPLSTEIFPTIKNRRALYVACLIHDIGKGRKEDHSTVGARLAGDICRRLGFSQTERDLVTWLVREHLTMSTVAQSRDLADPRTISDFAETVGSLERLKLLLLLTVADIRAVGPGTWNGWKGQLLRQLYYATAALLQSSETAPSNAALIQDAQAAFRTAIASSAPAENVDDLIARHYPDYWIRTDTETQVAHAHLLRKFAAGDHKIATTYSSDAFTEITQLMVVAPNHPRLLSLFAGCCAAAGANIIGAQINTTRDGLVLDDFQIERMFPDIEDEDRRAARISRTIEKVLRGEARLGELLAEQAKRPTRARAFSVRPAIEISNDLSDQFTVIDVEGRDWPGLLYELTSVLSDLNLDINAARITTFGERAVDAFYVTDLTGKKITDAARQEQIVERLRSVLAARQKVA